jgi:tetratricopeptide (TPR) repeat protein
MNLKTVLLFASLFLLVGLGLYLGKRHLDKGLTDIEGAAVAEMLHEGEIKMLVTAYQDRYFRWPQNASQLQKFAKENKAKEGIHLLHSYKGLTFTETPHKNLRIHYLQFKEGTSTTGPGGIEMNYDQMAKLDLSKKIEPNPKTAAGFYRLGCAGMFHGNYNQAVSIFTQAIDLKPHYGEAYLTRGESFNSERRYDRAIKDLTTAIQFNKGYWRGAAYFARGQAYECKRDRAHAIQDFKKAAEYTKDADSLHAVAKISLADELGGNE